MSQEVLAVTKSFKDWISEGENLYNAALKEYQSIEQQLDDLEAKLAAKKAEVNQIAQVIGKPPVETNRRLTAQLVEEHGPNSVPNSPATIARALTGRGLGR
jgi:chromosome segregation ATPase